MHELAWAAVGSGIALLAAGAWLWRRHRRNLADMRRRLEFAEESRFELERHAEEVNVRLAQMSRTLQQQQQALDSAREMAKRRAALEALLHAAGGAPLAGSWADTQPLDDTALPGAASGPDTVRDGARDSGPDTESATVPTPLAPTLHR